ncbi:DNA-3-methyladenine glycosylase 2 family protein [Longivirga aurantiaca]|uniref:DNA-3-methyladenine glycosylase II n=1 Tax=Longivirga aurantiaca TaxID=1837743 RepID=A0ABW1T223_9ACTN
MSSRVQVVEQPGLAPAGLDPDAAYAALAARDRRFDGRIWFGVTSTGVYCRPVCPAQTPKAQNVRFFAAPAAAVSAGFRACRRCRPDSAPGSRHWDHRGDLVGRALRLIADGAIDDGGVAGLARTLHVSERHLHRSLVAEVGAGPLQLAVSRRAQTAKLLVEQTDLSLAEIAFASGFSSVRQFNDVMRREFGIAPSGLRRTPSERIPSADPALVLRLRLRPPYDADALGAFLAARTVAGLEEHVPGRRWTHRRVVPLPTRAAVTEVTVHGDHVVVRSGADVRDTAALVRRVRRWLDLDADPATVDAALGLDPALAPLVGAHPGLRVPTTVDPWETVVRAVVGQQVSVAAAGTLLARLVAAHGTEVAGESGLRAFPRPAAIAALDPAAITGMPGSRARTLVALAAAVADGSVALGSPDLDEVEAALLAIPGAGPWTTGYVRLRALADPDAFPASDLGLRHAAGALGLPEAARALGAHVSAWSPWRSYAAQHLWTSLAPAPVKEPS